MNFLKKMFTKKINYGPNPPNQIKSVDARQKKSLPESMWSQRDQMKAALERNRQRGSYADGRGVGY